MLSARKTAVIATSIILAIVVLPGVWRSANRLIESDGEVLEAIRTGDVAAVRAYLRSGGSPDRRIDVYGRQLSMLKAAVVDREETVALALIEAGADLRESGVSIQEVGRQGIDTLLELFLDRMPPEGPVVRYSGVVDAALNGYYDTVGIYLSYASRSSEDWSLELSQATGGAMMAGYDDVALLILESGASLSETLHAASRFSSPGMVRYLLGRGLDPNAELDLPRDAEPPERTPIEFAWKRYQERAVLSETSRDASNAEFTADHDVEFVLYELLRAGASVENLDEGAVRLAAHDGIMSLPTDSTGRIVGAARAGFRSEVETELAATAVSDVVLRDALIAALASDHDDIARLLLAHGAPVEGGPLHVAAAASSPGMVRSMLKLGADPEAEYLGETSVQFWLAKSATEDPELILHELIRGGAMVCFLTSVQGDLPGMSVEILRHSAPDCWND